MSSRRMPGPRTPRNRRQQLSAVRSARTDAGQCVALKRDGYRCTLAAVRSSSDQLCLFHLPAAERYRLQLAAQRRAEPSSEPSTSAP